jgi:hypothetical protein
MLAAVDFHALGQVIWVSLAAGVGVTVMYSIVIYSSGKSMQARRSGNGTTAAVYGALATLTMLVFVAAVVLGVVVMLQKD